MYNLVSDYNHAKKKRKINEENINQFRNLFGTLREQAPKRAREELATSSIIWHPVNCQSRLREIVLPHATCKSLIYCCNTPHFLSEEHLEEKKVE